MLRLRTTALEVATEPEQPGTAIPCHQDSCGAWGLWLTPPPEPAAEPQREAH